MQRADLNLQPSRRIDHAHLILFPQAMLDRLGAFLHFDMPVVGFNLETMERVLGNSDKLVLDQGVNGSGPGVVPYLPLSEIGRRATPAAPQQGGSNR